MNGDKKRFASLCLYPIKRNYPLHEIENAQQMEAYFDTMFDMSYRKMLAKETADDKENHGWRGFAIGKGTVWIYDSVYAVSYYSAKERRELDRLAKKEMETLNPKMRGKGWKPYACYKDITGKNYVRIDVKGSYKYRLAVYGAKPKASSAPKVIMYGKLSDNWGEVSAEEGVLTAYLEPSLLFVFGNKKDTVTIDAADTDIDEDGTVKMSFGNDDLSKCHKLKPCFWMDEIKK